MQPRTVESAGVSLSNENELTVVEFVGQASACDVFFSVPEEWGEAVLLRLYAKLGTIKVLLHRVKLGDASVLVESGQLSGIALSVRGRPCTSFLLTAQRGPGDPLSAGRFVLNVWSDHGHPSAFGGAPIGEIGFSPTRAEPNVALMAGHHTDSGGSGDRFRMLKVDDSGALYVTAPSPLAVILDSPLQVEGTGTAGTPSGGVLSMQGPGSGGALTVTGDESGSLRVKGTRTPASGMTNPTACVDAGAFVFGWNGSTWDPLTTSAPSDALSNPTASLNSASFLLAWNGSTWARARLQTIASVASIANASAPPGVATAAFPYAFHAGLSQWTRLRSDELGNLLTSPRGILPLADNEDFAGDETAPAWSLSSHRNQDGNWYLSRGGYGGAIASSALPALMNVLGTGGHNTTAPAPSNGAASALQVDARASLVIAQGRPPSDARDTPDLIAFNGVDKGVIKASAGNLLSIELSNNHSVAVWFFLMNKATNPANGETPVWRTLVQVRGVHQLDRSILSEAGIRFATGISWAISTARATLTLVGGTPDVAVNATYV